MLRKKITAIAIVLSITAIQIFGFPSSFKNDVSMEVVAASDDYFDLYSYIADIWTDSVGSNGKGSPEYLQIHQYTNDFISPAQILVNELSANSTFVGGVIAWEILTFNPSNVTDDMLKEKDYYSAIIFSVLKTQMEDVDLINKRIQDSVTISDSFTDLLKTINAAEYSDSFNFKLLDGKKLLSDPKNAAIVDEWTNDWLAPKWSTKASKILGNVKDLLEIAEDVNDFVQRTSAYKSLLDVSADTLNYIEYLCDIAHQTENLTMEYALNEVYMVMQGAFEASLVTSMDFILRAGSFAYDKIVGTVWTAVISALNPFWAGALIGQAIGKFIANGLFSTDAIIEQFYKMRALTEFETLAKIAVNNLAVEYLQNKNVFYAQTYLKSVDVLFSTFDLGCDYGLQFLEVVYTDAWFSSVSLQSYEDVKKTFTDCKIYSGQAYQSLLTSWIFRLEEDYPEIYQRFAKAKENSENGGGVEIDIPDPNVDPNTPTVELENLSYSISNGKVTITRCNTSAEGKLIIPSTIEDLPLQVSAIMRSKLAFR